MKNLICIVCPKGCHLSVDEENDFAVTGAGCEKGIQYGKTELLNPTRVVTSTVKITGGAYPRLPVKTSGAIPKPLVFKAMEEINRISVTSPVKQGEVLIENLLGTGINLVAERTL
ncbi:MAG: DUF1667 domain-containing protein [Oscillospiraceae bacterium]